MVAAAAVAAAGEGCRGEKSVNAIAGADRLPRSLVNLGGFRAAAAVVLVVPTWLAGRSTSKEEAEATTRDRALGLLVLLGCRKVLPPGGWRWTVATPLETSILLLLLLRCHQYEAPEGPPPRRTRNITEQRLRWLQRQQAAMAAAAAAVTAAAARITGTMAVAVVAVAAMDKVTPVAQEQQ